MVNKGGLGGRGNFLNKFFKAATGHKGEVPRTGICTVANWEVSWRVLDHFITRVVKFGSKITSPLQRCTRGSKVEEDVGTRLESLKKAKKAIRNKGEYIKPKDRESQAFTMAKREGISKIPFTRRMWGMLSAKLLSIRETEW